MKLYPFYFLPLLIIIVLIHLLLRRPIKKEFLFPPFHLLRRIYTRYMWRRRVKNLLLILTRVLIALFFIVSASKISCGVPKKGEVILIDTSYSTLTENLFQKEIKIAQEMYERNKEVRIFGCSDELIEIPAQRLMKGELTPSLKKGTLTECLKRLVDEGYTSAVIISDGRKEGWSPAEVKTLSEKINLQYIDVSEGKRFKNAWIEEISGEKFVVKSNEDFEIRWKIETDTFSINGNLFLKGHRGEVSVPSSGFSYGVFKIEGDALSVDNTYYFVGKKGGKKVLIFDYFPSEVKYHDEAYYIRNALSKLKNIKVDLIMDKNTDVKFEDAGFIFLLNPPKETSIFEILDTTLKRKIPLFISAGDNGGFEEVCLKLHVPVKGVKELGGAERTLLLNPVFADVYPYQDIRDRIKVKKIFVLNWNESYPPILYLETGEPVLVKLRNKNVFLLLTTADSEWSHLPLSRFFLPILADIVRNSMSGFYEETAPFIPSEDEKIHPLMKTTWKFEELSPGIYEREKEGRIEKLIVNFIPSEESLLTPMDFELIGVKRVAGRHFIEIWKYFLFSLLILFPLESFLSR